MTYLHRLLPVFALLVAVPVHPAKAQTGAPVNAVCAVVESAAPEGDDPDFNKRWFQLNRVLMEGVSRTLIFDGYTAHTFEFDVHDPSKRLQEISALMTKNKCPEVIEISVAPRPDNKLTFKAMAFHLVRKDAMTVIAAGDYEKEYPFPLTQDTMDHLSISGQAQTMGKDIETADVLAKPAK